MPPVHLLEQKEKVLNGLVLKYHSFCSQRFPDSKLWDAEYSERTNRFTSSHIHFLETLRQPFIAF